MTDLASTTVPDPAWSSPESRPGEDHLAPVRVLDGVLLVVWSIVGQVLVVVAVALAGVEAPSGASLVAVQLLAQSVVLGGVLAWFAGRDRLTWRLFGSVPPSARLAGRGVVVGSLGFLLTGAVILLATLVTDVEPADQQLVSEALGGGLTTVLVVVSAVLFAPVVEEFVFRGVLFQALGRRLGVLPGALLSGTMFALVHLELEEPTYFLALALLGTLFALSYHRFRSLLVPVLAHATFNAVQLTLALSVGPA